MLSISQARHRQHVRCCSQRPGRDTASWKMLLLNQKTGVTLNREREPSCLVQNMIGQSIEFSFADSMNKHIVNQIGSYAFL